MTDDEADIPDLDLDRANVSRMYDYFLGGAHNFAVDRELADRIIAARPEVVAASHAMRSFLRRVVLLCVERGIDQFLDLGSGIPTVGNVHEVARAQLPTARVAYVEQEAVAVHHSRHLLRGVEGVTVTQADLRDADAVLTAPTVTSTLDVDRPVAILAFGVLHFQPEDPIRIVGSYRAAMVRGSALALNHGSADWDDPELAASMQARAGAYQDSSLPITLRDRREIGALFDGLELADPGLVDITAWRPDTARPGDPCGVYGGVGFVP